MRVIYSRLTEGFVRHFARAPGVVRAASREVVRWGFRRSWNGPPVVGIPAERGHDLPTGPVTLVDPSIFSAPVERGEGLEGEVPSLAAHPGV
jgi:hypothetical protein